MVYCGKIESKLKVGGMAYDVTYDLFAACCDPLLLPYFHVVTLAASKCLVHLLFELFDFLFEV